MICAVRMMKDLVCLLSPWLRYSVIIIIIFIEETFSRTCGFRKGPQA